MIFENFMTVDANLIEIVTRFLINIFGITILVRGLYFPFNGDKEYAFTFFLFNVLIFFICFLMLSTEISMGFGFGLFAIFGILRYRTITVPIKEMTFLFTAITIALINAIGPLGLTLIFMNITVLLFVYLMEKIWFSNKEQSTNIEYEKIDLLQENELAVLRDLQLRTGLNVNRYKIKSYNFLNDSASIKIYFTPSE